MFGSDLLGVGIGLIVLYLLLSILCSAASELVESVFKRRGRYLAQGIGELLNDPSGNGLVKQLYEHPLISALFAGEYKSSKHRNLPSYIPAHTFALALLDVVRSHAVSTGTVDEGLALVNLPLRAGRLVQDLSDGAGALAFGPASDAAPSANLLLDVSQSGALDSRVRTALSALIQAPDGASAALQEIENWYTAAMDRLTGWYKRRTQVVLLVFGAIAAGALNADTIAVIRSLANDPAARSAAVTIAEAYVKASEALDSIASLKTTASQTVAVSEASAVSGGVAAASAPAVSMPTPQSAAAGSRAKRRPASGSDTTNCDSTSTSAECRVVTTIEQVRSLGLPLNWDENDPRAVPTTPKGWAIKALGLLLTTVAVTLGAPFWFDLLSKGMTVRGALKPKAG